LLCYRSVRPNKGDVFSGSRSLIFYFFKERKMRLFLLIVLAVMAVEGFAQSYVTNTLLRVGIADAVLSAAGQTVEGVGNDESAGKIVGDIGRDLAIGAAVSSVAVPVAVTTAGALGVTASTGTAVAALSGAAATSATMAAIGRPVFAIGRPVVAVARTALAALGITITPAVTPAVAGALVVGAAAAGVGFLISSIFD
jgi:hypothetical protein